MGVVGRRSNAQAGTQSKVSTLLSGLAWEGFLEEGASYSAASLQSCLAVGKLTFREG